MTNTPKTAESSVAQASDNAAENTTEEATGQIGRASCRERV